MSQHFPCLRFSTLTVHVSSTCPPPATILLCRCPVRATSHYSPGKICLGSHREAQRTIGRESAPWLILLYLSTESKSCKGRRRCLGGSNMRQVSLGTRIHPRGCKSGTAQRGHILQAGPPSLSAGGCDWNSHKNSRNRRGASSAPTGHSSCNCHNSSVEGWSNTCQQIQLL